MAFPLVAFKSVSEWTVTCCATFQLVVEKEREFTLVQKLGSYPSMGLMSTVTFAAGLAESTTVNVPVLPSTTDKSDVETMMFGRSISVAVTVWVANSSADTEKVAVPFNVSVS